MSLRETSILPHLLQGWDMGCPYHGTTRGTAIIYCFYTELCNICVCSYFGGDLQVMSMEGYGTDSFIYLPRLALNKYGDEKYRNAKLL
jgi:hypothetical protein